MDLKNSLSSIVNKYQQMVQQNEMLTLKLENANLEIQLEKTKKAGNLEYPKELEGYVNELDVEVKKMFTIVKDQHKKIDAIKNQIKIVKSEPLEVIDLSTSDAEMPPKVDDNREGQQETHHNPAQVDFPRNNENIDPIQMDYESENDRNFLRVNGNDDDGDESESDSDEDESSDVSIPLSPRPADQRPRTPPPQRIIIRGPDFKIVQSKIRGELPALELLEPDNDDLYRPMYFDRKKKVYRCSRCADRGATIVAKLIKKKNKDPFIRLNKKHICGPVHCKKMEIIKLPKFKITKTGRSINDLFIIVDVVGNQNQKCYRMKYSNTKQIFICDNCNSMGKYVTAKKIKMDGEKVIKLKANHICEPIEYVD